MRIAITEANLNTYDFGAKPQRFGVQLCKQQPCLNFGYKSNQAPLRFRLSVLSDVVLIAGFGTLNFLNYLG
jgi:hypothetical protein